MIKAIQKALKGDKGFTLIELLVVVAIIGILVAIAIPQFASYKKQANDSAAEADIRNIALAAESYFATNNVYPATIASFTTAQATLPGFKATNNNTFTFTNASTTFTATAINSGGTGRTFTWDSGAGGLQ